MSAFFATWLPPDGEWIVFRGGTDQPAIFRVHPDGTGLERISRALALHKDDYQGIAASPDGRSISFERWTGEAVRVFVLDVPTGETRVLPTPPGTWQSAQAVFSPDGRQIAYWRTAEGGERDLQLVVAPADGSSEGRVVGPKIADARNGRGYQPVVWTPDGTAIVASIGTDGQATQWWIPLDGSPASEVGSGAFQFMDVQRLAP